MHSLRNNPARPAPRPPLSPQEAEELAKRLKGSYIANEEDAKRAEAEAKRNYDNLEDEMVMARKFKNDNASEKRKIEVQMADIREKLQGLRADWEAARAENEALRRKEPEMLEVKKLIDNGRLILTLAEMERKKDVWREYNSAMSAAKESYTKVNDMKCKLIEEDKAVKDKDGRRLKRFNEGIEGHDKRRFVMKSRLARACHYTIYHAKRYVFVCSLHLAPSPGRKSRD
jgi:chromosome segregation ATPase